MNHFFFVLLSRDWYTFISKHRIILVSTHSLLLQVVSGPSQSTISTCFSALTNLVQLKLVSTSQLWAVWQKASAQSSIMSHNSSAGLLFFSYLSLLGSKSSLVYIISQMPTQSLWSHVLTWEHASCLACHPQHFHWRSTCVMFTLGNRFISYYATYIIYAASQKGSSSQYSAVVCSVFIKWQKQFKP